MRSWVCAVLALSLTVASAEQVVITGRVVGPEGEGIRGAHVAVRRRAPQELEWVEVTSAEDGRFRLEFDSERPRGRYQVVAIADGFAFGAETVDRGGEVQIRLPAETASVSGEVVDAGGAPIAGAEVTGPSWATGDEGLSRGVHVGRWERMPRWTTGEDGRFVIDGLPPGARVALMIEAAGFADYWDPSHGNWPATGSDVEIAMLVEAVVTGRVTRDGEPVADVRVGAQATDYSEGGGWGDAVTDDAGRYEINGLHAGTYNVAIEAPVGYTAVAHEGLTVASGQRVDGIGFELIEGSLVRGRVTWAETGEPVGDARVAAYGPAHPKSGGWVQATTTDEQGRYELRLPPGSNYIYWMGTPFDAWYSEPEELTLDLGEDAVETVDLVLHPKPHITLTVLSPDGTPAAAVPVLWAGADRYRSSLRIEPKLTDEDGRVELIFGRKREERVRPLVPAMVQDTERDLAGLAVINGETTREATIALASGAWIEATASEQDGTPIAHLRVRVGTDENGWRMDLPIAPYTDAHGEARVGPLPAGVPLTIQPDWGISNLMLHPSAEKTREPITLEPSETRKLEQWIIAPEGLSLRGRVVDAEGNPVEGAIVVCTNTIDYRQEARDSTDPDGHFELTRLGTGGDHMVIACDADGARAFAQACGPRVAFEPLFELMPTGQLLVTVVDEGRPVPKARVQVEAPGTGRPELPGDLKLRTDWTEVDEQGRVRVTGLVPGLEYGAMALLGPEDEPELAGGREPSLLADGGPTEITIELMTRQELQALHP